MLIEFPVKGMDDLYCSSGKLLGLCQPPLLIICFYVGSTGRKIESF